MKLFLTVTMLVALVCGGPAVALDVGEKVGPVWVMPGAIICDTEEQAERAIDASAPLPAGCGRLAREAHAFIEAISEYEFRNEVFIILKITFKQPSPLGVQYGWQTRPNAPDGDPV